MWERSETRETEEIKETSQERPTSTCVGASKSTRTETRALVVLAKPTASTSEERRHVNGLGPHNRIEQVCAANERVKSRKMTAGEKGRVREEERTRRARKVRRLCYVSVGSVTWSYLTETRPTRGRCRVSRRICGISLTANALDSRFNG